MLRVGRARKMGQTVNIRHAEAAGSVSTIPCPLRDAALSRPRNCGHHSGRSLMGLHAVAMPSPICASDPEAPAADSFRHKQPDVARLLIS